MAVQLPRAKSDWWLLPDNSAEGLVVSKALFLNLNFNFLNRISLGLTSSSYPIVLTRLGEPVLYPTFPETNSRI